MLQFVCVLIITIYCSWQMTSYFSWSRLLKSKQSTPSEQPAISVIVPFRDEADNLSSLLSSLLLQDSPPLEIILVDDHSTDHSLSVIEEWCAAAGAKIGGPAEAGQGSEDTFQVSVPNIKVLSLAEHLDGKSTLAHKKAALSYGIAESSGEVIFTTDADCTLPPRLINEIGKSFGPNIQVVSGPVMNAPLHTFCDHFQAIDLASFQFLTAASIERGHPTLANGACFAFRKSAFYQVDGYKGVDHMPSGDDVLLLHKFIKHFPPTAFTWLTDGPVVDTKTVPGWSALWNQRLRWAGKAGNYQSIQLQFAQIISFLACFVLFALIPISLHLRSVALLIVLWLLKGFVDYLNLTLILRHYGRKNVLRYYLPTMLLYPFWLVAVGSAALMGFKAGWKGRDS